MLFMRRRELSERFVFDIAALHLTYDWQSLS